tara:strand:- start:266 stop:985 length:720 start_codon:yes stop_codon:yes gene_type:complete
MIELEINDICNLSKIPIPVKGNPCYTTCVQISRNPEIPFKETALFKWYVFAGQFQDKSLAEFYGLGIKSLQDVSYKSIFLPWIHSKPVTNYIDIAFLNVYQMSEIEKKVDKMKSLIVSLQTNGYIPRKFIDKRNGHISGYFLEFFGERKFYVVSGNHRVSAFFSLWPNEKIPAQYEKYEFLKTRDLVNNQAVKEKKMPELFSSDNVNDWPSVKSGFLKSDEALDIMKRYFSNFQNLQKS